MKLFVSLDLPDEVFHFLRDVQALMPQTDVLLTQHFHLTLFYLGEVQKDQLNDVKSALAEVKCGGFEVNMDGKFGMFDPENDEPRVVWVGVEKTEQLKDLKQQIAKKMGDLGFESEFDFVPHLTVGMVRGDGGVDETFKNIAFREKSFEVESFSLMQSEMTKNEAFYNNLETYRLA